MTANLVGQSGVQGYNAASPFQVFTAKTQGAFTPVPPVVVGGPEFDVAVKPWRAEPNSFGFDNRMEPK